ncbi:hypothetical protein [Pseudomonas typographi]|uniref:hypothetical protein n=1 Tax=Pseudomonas typographi TaxID=2715964 RepID=UPI001684C283|nr:hypothetical protein [Pseudomonas typographi]MBD1590066.1 hypothetical protein [Pseudomonas typographi]
MEKLLFWSFFVKVTSIKGLTITDIPEFLDFCLNPPSNWVCPRRTKRFIVELGVLKANPVWRPFVKSVKPAWITTVLNRFFSANSNFARLVLCPLSSSGIPKGTQCYCDSAEQLALDYLTMLKCHSVGNTVFERCLFLFATSFYLRISPRELFKYRELFTMQCFVFQGAGENWFIISTGNGMYRCELPDLYLEYFFRWRSLMGLPQYPEPTELAPIVMHSSLKNLPFLLPKLSAEGIAPWKILSLFLFKCRVCNGKLTSRALSKKESAGRYKDRIIDKQITNSGIDDYFSTCKKVVDCTSPIPVPAPLFNISRRTEILVQKEILVRSLMLHNETVKVEICESGLSLFDSLIRLKPGRLKLQAFEKLTLWSILICGKSPADLTTTETQDFYIFCLNPPPQWAGKLGEPRKLLRSEAAEFLANPRWRPFLQIEAKKHLRVSRAGRIIGWCNGCFRQLVRSGSLRNNPFSILNNYIN